MIWSLGLWWIWKVVNEHKEEHGTRFSQCNNHKQMSIFFLLRFWTVKGRKNRKNSVVKGCKILKDFSLMSFSYGRFSPFCLLPWVVKRWRTLALFECSEKERSVKGNSRLLFHWPDDDVQCFKMALNKLMSSRQEGCAKHTDSSTNNAADDHRMLKDPHFEV